MKQVYSDPILQRASIEFSKKVEENMAEIIVNLSGINDKNKRVHEVIRVKGNKSVYSKHKYKSIFWR